MQVGAGGECPVRPREHGDVERVVRLEAAERVRERRGGRAVDRVGDVRTVDRDHGDGPLVAEFDGHEQGRCLSRDTAVNRPVFRQVDALI
jgi:hypothetical protein